MAKRRSAEVIWRIKYLTNATGKTAHAEPVILILADRGGWQFLADWFSAMAKRKPTKSMISHGDADDHQHLSPRYQPAISSLSDQMEFRLGMLTRDTRKQTLQKYGIKHSSKKEDLPQLFTRLIHAAKEDVRDTNRSMRRAEKEPKMSEEELYAAFGIEAPKKVGRRLPKPKRKKRRP